MEDITVKEFNKLSNLEKARTCIKIIKGQIKFIEEEADV